MKLTTARALRTFLFYIDDQNMTVEQLRRLLFVVQEQDAPRTVEDLSYTVNVLHMTRRPIRQSEQETK